MSSRRLPGNVGDFQVGNGGGDGGGGDGRRADRLVCLLERLNTVAGQQVDLLQTTNNNLKALKEAIMMSIAANNSVGDSGLSTPVAKTKK